MKSFNRDPRNEQKVVLPERRPLSYPFQPDGFIRRLKQRGLRSERETRKHGEQRLTVDIPPGSYRFACGFPQIDLNDRRYFYGNLPVDKQERALQLDCEHPRFRSLLADFQDRLPSQVEEQFRSTCEALFSVMDDHFEPDDEDEDIVRMSQIIESGSSACAGLTLVAGLLVRSVAPADWMVQRIDGAKDPFDQQRPHDIGHTWLRISTGKQVALYDPYYRNLSVYDLENFELKDSDLFARYPVQALSFWPLRQQCRPRKFGGMRLVKQGEGIEAWLHSTTSHMSQITGNMEFQLIDVRGGPLELVNGATEVSRNQASRTSGRILHPINDIERI